ncbi:hypothetical protein [Methylobacterium mesophilicum]|uniref:hypothetical protein n=1 Tax=Methylobacterium mesophilicum TaxID=39956 RepID=UPI002F35C47B
MSDLHTMVLRPEVRLEEANGLTSISFAHWQVELPSDELKASAPLLDLLQRREINPGLVDERVKGLVTLLEAQGCFLPAPPRRMTERSLLKLFQPLRSQLYAEYYAHPAWERLRTGQASRGELTAWMIHNYHISRSAGVIAARMALATSDPDLREFFREDALEEYWHCDAFYFVNQAGARLLASDVKSYVPLPASTAFEDHALRVAEEMPLGHLLIAYFQESSIIFRHDSEHFYDAVEKNYGLPNAFVGWRKHMTLDLDHDHAGELEARFDDERVVLVAEAAAAIRAVQLAHFYLLSALDQIAAHADVDDALAPRLPSTMANRISTQDRHGEGSLSCDAGSYLVTAMREGAYRALALARTHDQIIATGRLASCLHDTLSRSGFAAPDDPWLAACRNYIIERAVEPDVFINLAPVLATKIAERCPELSDQAAKVLAVSLPRVERQGNLIAEFRLEELISLATTGKSLAALALSGG